MKKHKISHLPASEIDAQYAKQVAQIASLEHQLDWLKRQVFGRKSEQLLSDSNEQTELFVKDNSATSKPDSIEIKSHRRKSNKQLSGDEVNDTGLRFDDSVPQKIIEVDAPELNGDNADQYEIIDYKEQARLAQQPGSYVVLIYRKPVVRHKTKETVRTEPTPNTVLEGCYADVSVLAGIMVDKAVYHLPLYRQHQRMSDAGIQLSRATLTHWIQKAIALLYPIYQAQLEHILQSKILAMDEVPIKVGRKSKGKMKQTYYWPIYGEQDEIAFTWSQNRGFLHAKNQLTGFNGTLLTDGYTAYTKTVNQLNEQNQNVTHASCWAHCRRYFEKSLKMEPELAKYALLKIADLYQVEQHIRDENLDEQSALDYRQKHAEPVIDEFFNWIYEQRQRPELLPSNPISKALKYADERYHQLKVYLGDANIQIDTNHLERALRVIPMGRKNYLFCWSELGAENMGVLQSLMVTCRLLGINPYHYLVDVLQRVSLHPAKDVIDLTPRVWKDEFKDHLLTSDLAN